MRLSCISLAALLSQACAGIYPEYNPIAGYMPGTIVLDQGNIDLDQAAMETEIGKKDDKSFAAGKVIYESGVNSKIVASLTVAAATMTEEISKGTTFAGVGIGGNVVTATAYNAYPVGSTVIELKYTPGTCNTANPATAAGCFVSTGEVTDGSTVLTYTAVQNKAKRTLKGFSTDVEIKMNGETHAKYFEDYYGVWDYADQIVSAAFDKEGVNLKNGNVDFASMSIIGREQVVKKGTVYMNVFMWAIHEFEASINKCEAGAKFNQENAVHEWDEGVAFHVGNLAGNTGADGGQYGGNLVYAVGNQQCKSFGTCGSSGVETTGIAKVNLDLTEMYNRGRDELNAGDCDAAEKTKNSIADAMYIPIIQGTLKYAYKGEQNGGDEKAVAAGIALALAVLGRVHAANPEAAATIYDNMKTNAKVISASKVKAAFESVYDDLNISCESIGGLQQDDGTYYQGMEPCPSSFCVEDSKKRYELRAKKYAGTMFTCEKIQVNKLCKKKLKIGGRARKVCPVSCKFPGCK